MFYQGIEFDPQNVLALNHKNSCESKLSRSKNLVNPDREKANQLRPRKPVRKTPTIGIKKERNFLARENTKKLSFVLTKLWR